MKLRERQEVLQFAFRHNPKHLPIVFGLGGNNTQLVLEMLEIIDLDGADAILSLIINLPRKAS